jgi:MoaA/NifB/PqqE/SkfB family radical SAM enzyme
LASARTILRRFIKGYRRTGVFAITTRCNCRCQMCNMYENEPVDMRYSDVVKVLDFMAENKFLLVYFTGGEPSLHPDLVRMVRYADKLGLITSLTTNGTISAGTLQELKEAGLNTLSISIDSWDPAVAENVRKHRGILEKQLTAFENARKLEIRTYSLTYLGTHLNPDNIEKMVSYVNSHLDVPFGFCYPVITDRNTYLLGKSARMHSEPTMKEIVERLLALKKKGHRIVNMSVSMEEIVRFLSNQPLRFPCKGGEHVFYIDWFGNFYPCFMKSKLFNPLEGDKPHFLKNIGCNDCLIDCFREPSLLAYLSSPWFIKEIRSFQLAG